MEARSLRPSSSVARAGAAEGAGAARSPAFPQSRSGPVLLVVQLDSERRLDRAAADRWFRLGAAVSTSAPARRPERALLPPRWRRPHPQDCESDGVRALACRSFTPAYVVPLHCVRSVEPRGAPGVRRGRLAIGEKRLHRERWDEDAEFGLICRRHSTESRIRGGATSVVPATD